MDITERIAESNRIEGISRSPTPEEIDEHVRFTGLTVVTMDDLIQFVKVYQPNAEIRDRKGLNVRVGNHHPPPGGPAIREDLAHLLITANAMRATPLEVHMEYETLHPFTDGNGRSGRVLWYWMMRDTNMVELGFLHCWYYQTLRAYVK